jgi:hypothetical protein
VLAYQSSDDRKRAVRYRGPRAIAHDGRTWFKHQGRWYCDEFYDLTPHGRLVTQEQRNRRRDAEAAVPSARPGVRA